MYEDHKIDNILFNNPIAVKILKFNFEKKVKFPIESIVYEIDEKAIKPDSNQASNIVDESKDNNSRNLSEIRNPKVIPKEEKKNEKGSLTRNKVKIDQAKINFVSFSYPSQVVLKYDGSRDIKTFGILRVNKIMADKLKFSQNIAATLTTFNEVNMSD